MRDAVNRQPYQFASIVVTCGVVSLHGLVHVRYDGTSMNPLTNYWRRRAEWKARRRNRGCANGR